jgi:RNA polymerase sigma factor (sigma-70 family)
MTDASDAGHAAQLYETYAGGVFQTCLALLGNREDAADATQEVFLRLLPQMDHVAHPCAWLQTAARHLCADMLRRRQVAHRHGVPAWGGDRAERDPAEVVAMRQEAATVMAGLPERESRILAHVGLLDAPVAEIAERMRLSYSAARQLLVRARHRAAQVGQLPSVVSAPPLARLTRLVRRLPGPMATPGASVPRGAVTGGALALCASLVCTGAPPHAAVAVHVPAAPSPTALVAPPHAQLAVPGSLVASGAAQAVHGLRRPALPTPRAASAPLPTPCIGASALTHTVWSESQPNTSVPAQVRLTRGTLGVDEGDTLVVRIYVADMSLDVPLGSTGVNWMTTFTAGGTQYIIEADASPGGGLTYEDWKAAELEEFATSDTGHIQIGPDGYAEVDVPFSHLGISRGSVISGIWAGAGRGQGSAVTATGDAPYVVGVTC